MDKANPNNLLQQSPFPSQKSLADNKDISNDGDQREAANYTLSTINEQSINEGTSWNSSMNENTTETSSNFAGEQVWLYIGMIMI